jgi:hypothetical protein
MENLPSPNYKTRQFTRITEVTIPDDATREQRAEEAERQQKIVETLVKNDIARVKEELQAGAEGD